MTERIENVIFENILFCEEYAKKVIPFLSDTHFTEHTDKVLYKIISDFYHKYNAIPTKEALNVCLDDSKNLKQKEYDHLVETIAQFEKREQNQVWLEQRTEEFVKKRALYNAIMTSIGILDGNNTKYNEEAIPGLLQDALAVSFDKTVGHDYFDNAQSRYEFYHLKEDRLPFGLELFNKISKGGLPKKTLSCVVAGVNVGKSLFLCDAASSSIRQGKNVLYITMEMAEERIAERVDCNLMNINIDDLARLDRKSFDSKINKLAEMSYGKFIVKEYPTGGAHVGHFKSLLDELKLKKNFKPDVIYVDYLNICASQRLKNAGGANSYTIIKSVAEELRGLAVEYDVPIMTATQFTRSASTDTDSDMTGIAESFGTAATMDFIFALMRTEELDAMGQIMVKQLKSRFGDVNYYKRFVIGVDIHKFKLYDVDNPTADLSDTGRTEDDVPVFDKSKFGQSMLKRGDVQELNFD